MTAVAETEPSVQELKDRIHELEASLADNDQAFYDDAYRLGLRHQTPGRQHVAQCVRRLAEAAGRQGTHDALLQLAGACHAWARRLKSWEGRGE